MSDQVAVPAPTSAQAGNQLSPQLRVALVSGLLAIILLAGIFTLPVPYVIFGPGPATNVLGKIADKPLISISGPQTYPASGSGTLDMTTIEVFGGPGSRVTLAGALRSWISGQEAVVPRDAVYRPTQTASQVASENSQQMVDSQSSASAAGLREAGLKVTDRLTVGSVNKGVPASSVLRAGDLLLAIDNQPVVNADQMRKLLSPRPLGSALAITVRRNGKPVTVSTKTTMVEGRSGLGVVLSLDFLFPANVKVSYASQDVGGPSAGMMFALGIYDLLTPGDLTGGQAIAGTGEITGDGEVRPIGGIPQKLVGAREAGARWFLAPAANCAEVVGNIPDGLRVIRTSNLHSSRLAVEAIAAGRGDSLPGC